MAYTTINKSTDNFTTTLWTGDSTTPKTFTTGTFKPDWLWGKNRSQSYSHQIYDTTRGAGNDKELVSNSSGAQGASNPETYGYVSAFTSTGFTATRGTDSAGDDYWNESPDTYVAWSWKANGGTTSSNSDGSITSTVQANTTAGFSIVKYVGTGSGSNSTVGHGLGVKPAMIIVKNLGSTGNWVVWHKSLASETNSYLRFDTTGAVGTTTNYWNNAAPTNQVFGVSPDGYNNNKNGENIIAYCFADKTGYSKFGSYTGNGNADGPFVYTGFKPAFVIRKNADATADWAMVDNKRPGYNVIPYALFPNLNNNETTDSNGYSVDLLSNGFKVRGTSVNNNTSGQTYIYMAFGQSLVGSNNIPCVAR